MFYYPYDVFKCRLLTISEVFALGSSVHSVCVDLPHDVVSASFPQRLWQASSSRDLIIVFCPKSAVGFTSAPTPSLCFIPHLPPTKCEEREKEGKTLRTTAADSHVGVPGIFLPPPTLDAKGYRPATHSMALPPSSYWPNQQHSLNSVTRAAALQRLSTFFTPVLSNSSPLLLLSAPKKLSMWT